MKTIRLALMTLVAVSLSACNAQASQEQKAVDADNDEVQLYYFHFTKRCATCNAVETETQLVLEMFYGDQVKDGTIAFTSLNLEEDDGKELAKALNVSGQTLLLVKGDDRVNLTNDGFMNARTKADKFHEILKRNIDNLL